MKVLILGARGMLGGALCEVFSDLNPVCQDKNELDITDEKKVRDKVKEQAPNVIINAAAYTDVDGAETEIELAMAVNRDGVRHVAQAAQEVGASLVHYSTDYVFPGRSEEGYAEDDVPGPAVNKYGQSKLAGEQALNDVNVDHYLLRTAWLYGAGGKNFVNTMLRLGNEVIDGKRDGLSVINDQYGSPTYVQDVARATRQLLEGSYKPGIYHVVNSGQTTWYGLAREIFAQSNLAIDVKPVRSEEYPRPARRPAYSVLKNTRGPDMRPWQEALGDYLGAAT